MNLEGLTGFGLQAKAHWENYRPKMVEKLKAQGLYRDALILAQETAKDVMVNRTAATVGERGMAAEMAREYVLRTFIHLPDEKEARKVLAAKSDFLGAIRLPRGTFGDTEIDAVNRIASIHRRDTGEVGNWLKGGLLRYWDEEKAKGWITSVGLQPYQPIPEDRTSTPSILTIPTNLRAVKRQSGTTIIKIINSWGCLCPERFA